MPRASKAGIWGIIFLFPLISQAEFYSFVEKSNLNWQDPIELVSETTVTAFNLLQWKFHSEDRPLATEKYVRLKHFGTWVDDSRTSECYDTRALVLMRDSQIPAETGKNPCKVDKGLWADPYSGTTLESADVMDVDHVVALKNAYDSGAWSWDYQHRCLYTNFLGYKNHLI
jgi:hypothetical protein